MITLFKNKEAIYEAANAKDLRDKVEELIPQKTDILANVPDIDAVAGMLEEDKALYVPFMLFFSFLDYHKALDAYLAAFNKQNQLPLVAFLSELEEHNFIFQTFDWELSEEGVQYWAHIDELWALELTRDPS